MENELKTNLIDMLEELNVIKKSTLEMLTNSTPISPSRVKVLSYSSDNTAIQINLNELEGEDNGIGNCDSGNDNNNNGDDNERKSGEKDKHDYDRINAHKTGNDSENAKESCDLDNSCNSNHLTDCHNNEFSVDHNNLFNNLINARTLRRTISESSHEDHKRGILKYPRNWHRRTVSESYDLNALSDYFISEICDKFIDESCSEDDLVYENKPKKNVRFDEHISKTVYRSTSSILGRKLKNQKRSRNRKNARHHDCLSSVQDSNEITKYMEDVQRKRQDSGYDSDDSKHVSNVSELTDELRSYE